MTDDIRAYAEEKYGGLTKYFTNIQQADIEVGIESSHHQKGKVFFAEANISIPGRVLRVRKNSEDLYKAIDKVKDHLKVEFEKTKGKMRRIDKKELRESKGYSLDE